MARIKIRTIDISALMWMDKIAGNTYFVASVTVNYRMKGERTYPVDFKYGYNDSYQFEALKVLQSLGVIEDYKGEAPWRYCQEHGIILRTFKTEGCKRAELTQFINDLKA